MTGGPGPAHYFGWAFQSIPESTQCGCIVTAVITQEVYIFFGCCLVVQCDQYTGSRFWDAESHVVPILPIQICCSNWSKSWAIVCVLSITTRWDAVIFNHRVVQQKVETLAFIHS